MTDIPPPRYKVVERKGRIIVTDTWAEGGRPAAPRAAMQAPARRGGSAAARWALRLCGGPVRLACLGATDEAGRPILTTHHHFDEKGPRDIVLGDASVRRLGGWMLGALAAAIVSIIVAGPSFAAALGFGALGLVFTSANTTARPAITRWLDTLGDEPR